MVAEFYIDRMCKVFRFSLLFFFASNVFCDNSNHYYIEMSNNIKGQSNNFSNFQMKDNEIEEVHQLKSNYGKNSHYNFGNNIRKDKYSNNKLNNPLLNTNNNGYGYTNKCCSCINCKTGLFSCKYNCLGNSCSKKRFFFTAGGFVILFGLGIGLGMLIYYLCLDNSRNNINIIPNSDNTTDVPIIDNTTDIPIIDNTTDVPIIDNTTDTPTYIPSDDKYEEEEEIAKESESTDVKEDEKETCKEEEKETAKESEGTDIKEEEKETAKESEGTDTKEEEKEQENEKENIKEDEGTDTKEEEKEQEKETAKESAGTDVKEDEKETAKESEGTDVKEEEKETAKESEGTDTKEEEKEQEKETAKESAGTDGGGDIIEDEG